MLVDLLLLWLIARRLKAEGSAQLLFLAWMVFSFLLGAGVLCWTSWMVSTLFGRVLGAVIDDPTRYGLDFAFTATFLALLLGMWKGRGDLVPWIAGALIAMVTARLVEGNWYIIAGGLGGSFAGAVFDHFAGRREARDVR